MADTKTSVVVEVANKDKSKKSRYTEKCTFLFTCVAIVTLSQSIVAFQWLVPFVYVTFTLILISYRIFTYCKRKWHFFLLDFCYYANTFCMIFLCFVSETVTVTNSSDPDETPSYSVSHLDPKCFYSIPDNRLVFSVVYSLSMGPLISAIPVYWNSLVLHDIDKVTSTYIHILPPLLSFVVRWYPEETSKYWFKPFMPDMPELSPVWMYLVPFLAFVIHSGMYSFVVNYLYRSSDNKISSYNYLGEKEDSKLFCLFQCVGSRCRCCMFYVWNWAFCLVALCCSLLSYYSFPANCFFLAIFSAMAAWNGGSYYVHVFSVRGFVDELE